MQGLGKNMIRQKVAVLMGGVSSEREVSLISGNAVKAALCEEGLSVAGVDVVDRDARRLAELLEGIDIAFIALHGAFGEDGGVQKILEELSIPYTGSGVAASYNSFNKLEMKKVLEKAGIPTPEFFVGEGKLGFPMVVKPCSGGSAIGVSIVRDKDALEPAVSLARRQDSNVMVEEFIEGKEITVSILGNLEPRVLPTIEIVSHNEFYDYEAKYTRGMSEHIIPPRLPEGYVRGAEEKALLAYRALGCLGFSRIDIIVTGDGVPYILDVNTIPGLTRTSLFPDAARAAGIKFNSLCLRILELAQEANT